MKPLFVYMGSKRRMLAHIEPLLPPAEDITLYVEPFFGGGAVFGSLREHYKGPAIINDVNQPLIGIYRALQENPRAFLDEALEVEARMRVSDEKEAFKAAYYRERAEYWEDPTPGRAYSLLFYCFNGQATTKEIGGRELLTTCVGDRPYTYPTTRILPHVVEWWGRALQETSIESGPYEALSFADGPGVLLYIDPPYRNTTGYSKDAWSDEDQLRLIQWCKERVAGGSTVIYSNVDHGDGFFQEALGDDAVIYTALLNHKCGGNKARYATELLAVLRSC